MKNLFTVFAFAFVMLCSVNATAQSLSQDQQRPEVVAKTEVAQLTSDLGLTGDQTRAIYRTLVVNERDFQNNIKGKDQNSAAVIAEKKRLAKKLDETMKTNLTAAQYQQWVASKQ